MAKLKIFSDIYTLSRAAGEFFVTQAKMAIEARGRFTVVLSGGGTPETLYSLLASDNYSARIEWDKVHIFWCDERCVPPDHVDSNYRMADHALLAHVPIPETNIHRVLSELKPHEAAQDYDARLHDFFSDDENLSPRFDLIWLGLGNDGHTASLFPYTEALQVTDKWVVANSVDDLGVWRVTMTAGAINAAENIVFLISGKAKAERLKQVMEGDYQPDRLPVQLIKPVDGQLIWLLDEDANALLKD